ncbi:MAG: hypothetical protein GY792_36955, partial [Gammaproteobacteria bacterium]|nr:hypothetical protein [Gammaproteobacteria bacterium]
MRSSNKQYHVAAGDHKHTLISRSVQERDKRSKLVHLTETGKDLIEESMDKVHDIDREMLDTALSKSELDQLVTLLGRALGACPRIENLLWKSWIWPYFPIIFVKYAQYSPQMIEKFDSNLLSLA